MFIALETLKKSLDGHAADVRPNRRAKTKTRILLTWLRRMLTALDPNAPEKPRKVEYCPGE